MRSKKGISPILATLLLIVIAVAAVIVTYAWVLTFTTTQTGQAGIFLRKDSVSWNTGNITVYARNTGTDDATIDAVYIGTSSANLAKQTSLTYDPSTGFVAKDGGTVTITIAYSWTTQTTYYFRIAPKVGEPLAFQETAP